MWVSSQQSVGTRGTSKEGRKEEGRKRERLLVVVLVSLSVSFAVTALSLTLSLEVSLSVRVGGCSPTLLAPNLARSDWPPLASRTHASLSPSRGRIPCLLWPHDGGQVIIPLISHLIFAIPTSSSSVRPVCMTHAILQRSAKTKN